MENIKKDEMDAELPSLPQPMRLQYERQHVPCEKECYTADQTLAYGRACMALRQPAQHIPGNFTTHRTAWRDAITECINHETNAGQPDRAAYWEHELAAYDRAFARLLDNPEAVRSPAQCAAPDERTDAGQAYKALDRAQKVIDWHTSIAMMTDDDLDTVRKYLFAKLNEAAPAAQPARPSLFESKLAGLEQRGYEVIGRILHKDGQYALFDSSCRWLTRPQYQRLMHEQDDSLFGAAQPEAKAAPVDAGELPHLPGCLSDRLYEAIRIAYDRASYAGSTSRMQKWDATESDLRAAFAKQHAAGNSQGQAAQPEQQPVAAQQNGGLVRAALIDLMEVEQVALRGEYTNDGTFNFAQQSHYRALFARARAAIAAPVPAAAPEPKPAVRDVLAERARQVEAEGWKSERDDRYIDCELARAAATYMLCTSPDQLKVSGVTVWPWAIGWWKPTTYRRNLVKAGALLLAEIERIDRAAAPVGGVK